MTTLITVFVDTITTFTFIVYTSLILLVFIGSIFIYS